jgi:hypothetical protein
MKSTIHQLQKSISKFVSKTLKNTIAILILAFTFSCSKNDEATSQPTPVVAEFAGLLIKTVDSDDGLTSNYTYDNAKRLINYKLNGNANNAAKDHNFTYNTDGSLAQITNVSDASIISKYFYDTDKKLVKKESRNGIDVFNYTYSGNQVIEKYAFNGVASWIQVYSYNTIGNVLELKSYNQITVANPNGNLSGTFIYTYDDKKSSNKSLPKEYLFPKSNVNNVATEKYNSGAVYTNNYEYNEKGYPTKRITTYTRTFEYQ